MLFRWLGQRFLVYDVLHDGRIRSWVGDYLDTFDPAGLEPDPTNGATKGALLEAVREAWKDPSLSLIRYEDDGRIGWGFASGVNYPPQALLEWYPDEFTALLAAWKARPREGRSSS